VRRVSCSRLAEDQGAVAVIVALMMTVLLGFVAISVDVGSLYSERRQLQNGADAAALALACHRGTPTAMTTTATGYLTANVQDGRAAATVTTTTDGQVTVTAESRNAQGTAALPLSFAPALGIGSAVVSATSTAGCPSLVGGTTSLPLAFSRCAFNAQTGGGVPTGTQEYTVILPKKDDTSCSGTSGNPVPGGFGWLQTDGTGCEVDSTIGTELISNPGNHPSCNNVLIAQNAGTTVTIPIYDHIGPGGGYVVSGYAAFRLTGYYFAGQYALNSPCSGADRCIRGYFTTLLDSPNPSFVYSPTAPNLGVTRATLTA
jgi:Flp pilus assembly protein TadG